MSGEDEELLQSVATFEYEAGRYVRILAQIDAIVANLQAVRQVIKTAGERTVQSAKLHADFTRRLHEENYVASLSIPELGNSVRIDEKSVKEIYERKVKYLSGVIESDLYDFARWHDMFKTLNEETNARFDKEYPPEAVDKNG